MPKHSISQFYNNYISVVTNEEEIRSPGLVLCTLPENLPTFFTYGVAISNDGNTFVDANHPFQRINVGDSRQMRQECVAQRKYRSMVPVIFIVS